MWMHPSHWELYPVEGNLFSRTLYFETDLRLEGNASIPTLINSPPVTTVVWTNQHGTVNTMEIRFIADYCEPVSRLAEVFEDIHAKA